MRRRRLHIRYAMKRGALPAIVAASLSPIADGCSASRGVAATRAGTPDGSVAEGGAAGVGGQAPLDFGAVPVSFGGQTNPRSPFPDSNDGGPNSGYGFVSKAVSIDSCDLFVELPPQGTPALVQTICADDLRPVESGWAARVTLSSTTSQYTEGTIQIADDLAGRVVGLPEVSVVGADAGASATFSNMQPRGDGYWFLATGLPPQLGYDPGYSSITLRVSFDIRCDADGGAGTTRRVEALTVLHFCENGWVSSGALCDVCAIIAEMAPTPIVPGPEGDDLPLRRALRLNLKTVAKVGRSLVLLAEHDAGDALLEYAWTAADGDLQLLGDDVAVWTPPDDDETHLLQVAVTSRDAAAVASLRRDRAA